ncbi:retrovirus-related Pol polyprotein from transposon 412 [Trichonephila clavipes]|uniref:Retrovirus-related Pol polyprotein from transposon 412 n=1 Tax=Trichonephila clavipes TaxID=2585209 RepID=A0A8X6VM61_TRICX|nr:retrovirus-related Pol polyprotein from transposon 412 [Trichonephila clavipes]
MPQREEDLEKKLLASGNATNESKFVPAPVHVPSSAVPMTASPVSCSGSSVSPEILQGLRTSVDENKIPEYRRKLAGVCLRSRKARQLGFLRPPSNCARSNLFAIFRRWIESWGNPEGYPIVRQVTTSSISALDPWRDKSVRKDQLVDPEIKPIVEFKELSYEKPSWQDIASFRPTTKRYWALWDSLHLRNGVLHQKWESDDGKTFRWQLILPKTRVLTILKELNSSPTGGHFGVMKTLQKVQVCKRLWEILAIDKTRTTALHPQSDGIVERFNRTILNSLSLLVSSIQQDWDKKLPFFLLAYRSVPFTRPSTIPHPRCSLNVIFVCLQIFCSAGHQMSPWCLKSISRNSRHGEGANASSS